MIEEECTGNGTLAAVAAGVVADAVLLPEPTNLELLIEGIGILWFELTVEGRPTHAQAPGAGTNAIELALPLIAALHDLEAEINVGGGRYALNIGTFHSDDWTVLPELGLTLGWRATDNVRVTLGYSLLWLDRVARAGDQVDLTVNPTLIPASGVAPTGPNRPAVVFTRSDVWIQAISLGVEFTY